MWQYIEAADWTNNSEKAKGYEIVKLFFMANYTKELNGKIRTFVDQRFMELDERINDYEKENGRIQSYGGDDSYGDMIHHVIGLGEEFFSSVMVMPSILDDFNFVESFAYGIPYETDFETLDINVHKNRAIVALQAITEIMVAGKASIEDVETMRQMQNRFMFMATGDVVEATRGWSDDRYDEYYKFAANNKQAMFSNYLSDARDVAHLFK